MKILKNKFIAFLKDEEGLTMTEYAVAGGLIVVGGAAVFLALGDEIERVIQLIVDELKAIVAA